MSDLLKFLKETRDSQEIKIIKIKVNIVSSSYDFDYIYLFAIELLDWDIELIEWITLDGGEVIKLPSKPEHKLAPKPKLGLKNLRKFYVEVPSNMTALFIEIDQKMFAIGIKKLFGTGINEESIGDIREDIWIDLNSDYESSQEHYLKKMTLQEKRRLAEDSRLFGQAINADLICPKCQSELTSHNRWSSICLNCGALLGLHGG